MLKATHIGESDLRRGSLSQEKFSGGIVENENRESSVKDGTGLLRQKFVGFSFGSGSDDVVLVIQHKDCVLLHHVLLGHGISIPCSGCHLWYTKSLLLKL